MQLLRVLSVDLLTSERLIKSLIPDLELLVQDLSLFFANQYDLCRQEVSEACKPKSDKLT